MKVVNANPLWSLKRKTGQSSSRSNWGEKRKLIAEEHEFQHSVYCNSVALVFAKSAITLHALLVYIQFIPLIQFSVLTARFLPAKGPIARNSGEAAPISSR